MSELTLGSLFDGSGGFPLGGMLAGIRPVWASEIEPFPIRVTTKRMPFVKHYGDVSAMDGGDIEPVDIITFGSPCFPAGTLVVTDKGLIEIENIHVGDMVLTHKGRWRKVTAVGSKTAPIIRLKGNHCGLVCTKNHPIYSRRDGCYEWIHAENMLNRMWGVPNKTEYLPMPRRSCMSRKEKPMPEFSEGFFYFTGRWVGDGWVRDGQRPGRPEGQRNSTIFLCDSYDKLAELEETVSCISSRYSIEYGDTCVKVKCSSRLLCDWLTENYGKYAHDKGIPSWCFSMPEAYRAALLRGILDSDGYKKKHSYKITTVSRKLAFGIRILAETLGYSTTVYSDERPETTLIEGREVHQKNTYSTEIFDIGSRKSDGNISWYRVKSIAEESPSEVVYNLTVEEDNSYTADSIIVHNCQDMSIAGKRGGLGGSRSSLFFEAVRIINEMRTHTNGEFPKYIVWENVPGALSSGTPKGSDFQAVLTEVCRICDNNADVPLPSKWHNAGEIVADGYSVAWRILDASMWGVPQRRKRIYLVADLTGGRAGKILFESEGLSGYSAEGFRAWQSASRYPSDRVGTPGCGADGYNSAISDIAATLGVNRGMSTGRNGVMLIDNIAGRAEHVSETETAPTLKATHCKNPPAIADEYSETPKTMKIRCGRPGGGKGPLIQNDLSATLSTMNDQTLFQPIVYGVCSKGSNSMKSDNPNSGFYEADTSRTLDGNGGDPSCNQGGMVVIEGNGARPSHQGDGYRESDTMYTLNATEQHGVAYAFEPGIARREGGDSRFSEELAPTIRADSGDNRAAVAYSMTTGSFMSVSEEEAPTLMARDFKDPTAVAAFTQDAYDQFSENTVGGTLRKSGGMYSGGSETLIAERYIVRRLTPVECARLQGFPDAWCDGLETPEPTEADIEFWTSVWETRRLVIGTSSRPKSRKQIIEWLKHPYTDANAYKLWGNGVALPNVWFVLSGIVWADDLSHCYLDNTDTQS